MKRAAKEKLYWPGMSNVIEPIDKNKYYKYSTSYSTNLVESYKNGEDGCYREGGCYFH